jgi:hypothetical protein
VEEIPSQVHEEAALLQGDQGTCEAVAAAKASQMERSRLWHPPTAAFSPVIFFHPLDTKTIAHVLCIGYRLHRSEMAVGII